MKSKVGLLFSVTFAVHSFHPGYALAEPFSKGAPPSEIEKVLATVTSMEDFLGRLPEEIRQNYVVMADSESAQSSRGADPCAPAARFILQSRDAKDVWSFSTAKDERGKYLSQTVERIRFDDKTKAFEFSEIDFTGMKPKLAVDPSSCRDCHGTPARPNWDAYDNWAGMLPFNRDRVYEDSHEAKAFTHLLSAMPGDPRARHLPPPKGATVAPDGKGGVAVTLSFAHLDEKKTFPLPDGRAVPQGGKYFLLSHPDKFPDEGQGVALFDNLTKINAQRVAEDLRRHPSFPKLKYALAGALKGCLKTEADASAFLPAGVLQDKKRTLATLAADTEKARKSLPALKAKLARKSLRQTISCNLQREGAKASAEALDGLVEDELHRRSDTRLDETRQLVDREVYDNNRTITALQYALEPDVSVANWSMGVLGRRRTLTFADLFDTYESQLNRLVADDPELSGKTCAALGAASLAAFAKAAAAPPAVPPTPVPGVPRGPVPAPPAHPGP